MRAYARGGGKRIWIYKRGCVYLYKNKNMKKYMLMIDGEILPIFFMASNLADLILFLDDYEIEYDDVFPIDDVELYNQIKPSLN
jgi:hypothetical protein